MPHTTDNIFDNGLVFCDQESARKCAYKPCSSRSRECNTNQGLPDIQHVWRHPTTRHPGGSIYPLLTHKYLKSSSCPLD